ncbi:NAD-binding protein [Halobaculum gomorrense]|uniref:Voltage-gated potassium channel n=1 Tax=Halobaculum gomorrense TaxID=43928 RepID=A0A1M5PEV3_9EURY|nr:NAD-binding protein [Halobaculum gomorrense]SHG99793.1 voltage-gated potassium channel [Halobaculum gomorrense]
MAGEPPEELPDSALERLFYDADRVRLVDWRRVSGAKPAVLATGVATVLAFVAGLSNLSQPSVPLDGPLAAVVPAAGTYAQFAGVLCAFALGPITLGLNRGKALAWYAALAVLPAVGVLPLVTLQPTDVPLLATVGLALPLLVWNRERFDESLDLSSLQIAALAAVLGVVVYGSVGSYGLQSEFTNLSSWSDAVYYVIVTIGTVGYGDITPLSARAKWFSLSVILFGTGAFTIAVSSLVAPAIESRMAAAFGNMSASELTLLEDHVLVLGYNDLTEPLLEELGDGTDVAVITDDGDAASHLEAEGVNVLTADPTDDAALHDANVGTARGVVVALTDDSEAVLAVVTARKANPDIRIVTAASDRQQADKLRHVGADEVISPTRIGGRLLGRTVLGASALFDGDDQDDDAT